MNLKNVFQPPNDQMNFYGKKQDSPLTRGAGNMEPLDVLFF